MQVSVNRSWAIILGCILSFPTAYFILISVFKYAFGIPFLFDSAQPLLERLGIKEAIGLNINLLILFGPLLALALNLLSVLHFDWYNESDEFGLKFTVQKHWWNMALVIFSGILLAILFIYAVGENCRGCE